MLIPIFGDSAAEFWLGPGAAINTSYSINSRRGIMSFPEDFRYQVTAEVSRLLAKRLELKLPLETFSFNPANHWCGKVNHVLTRYRPFPPKSFILLKVAGYEIAMARPEWCFLQAAKHLDMAQLVLFGMRLCALYYLQPEIKAEQKKQNGHIIVQKSRTPVTTAEMIAEFLETADGEFGIRRARKAVKFVVDNANSPMEAALATIMNLPAEYGGYEMPAFTMNETIDMSDRAKDLFGMASLRVDFFWREEKKAAEYNSYAFHSDRKQQAIDVNRTNALQQSGYRVLPITYSNLQDFESVEKQMNYLRGDVIRPDLVRRLAENAQLREQLCKKLLGTGASFYDKFI